MKFFLRRLELFFMGAHSHINGLTNSQPGLADLDLGPSSDGLGGAYLQMERPPLKIDGGASQAPFSTGLPLKIDL